MLIRQLTLPFIRTRKHIYEKKSLIIGINNYNHFSKLDNCINDATDFHNFLENNGFESELLKNSTQKELLEKISEFKESISDNTISLIYFSGHGLQDEGYNYIVASNSEIKKEIDIKYNCILANDLLIETSKKKLHFLILDACRNNPFYNGRKGISFGLSKMNAPSGTLIAFSTSPNTTSVERKNERNGIYTKHLLEKIKIPNLPIEFVLKYTRDAVMLDTSNEQVPWEESSLIGKNFSFVTKDIQNIEIDNLIDKWVNNQIFRLPQLLPLLEEPFFSSLSLEKLQLLLSLVKIEQTKEQNSAIQSTIDEDFITERIIDFYLPNFLERIIKEDKTTEIFSTVILDKINIENKVNYGFNWLEEPINSFPQLVLNEIKYKGKFGILSCFLFIKDNKQFLKPLIIIKESPISFFTYSILGGEIAETVLTQYFRIRKPFEKETPNLDSIFNLGTTDFFESE